MNSGTSELCRWLHEQLERLPIVRYPFRSDGLPKNGIYFLYEEGEMWGHGGSRQRIVRIGTHKDGNFGSRISEHYVLNETKMRIEAGRPAPKDRSIFRKNIGRALLNKTKDDYLKVWEIDFMTRDARKRYGHLRSMQKERQIESKVTEIIRQKFSFRYVTLRSHVKRMGTGGLEGHLIGTVGNCGDCKPSDFWLGTYSPKEEIRTSGLWLVQHLFSPPIDDRDKTTILEAITSMTGNQL